MVVVAFVGGIGGQELLFALAIALVIFGPKRLPEIARRLSQVTSQLRDANRQLKRELYTSMDPEALEADRTREAARVAALRRAELDAAVPAAVDEPPATAPQDPDAPYRDAEAEAAAARAAAAKPPPTEKADPDDSGSAS